jgi:transcriptional regulator with XRE-family HTH domain
MTAMVFKPPKQGGSRAKHDPVIHYFSERLHDLIRDRFAQRTDKRRGPRKVTPLTVHKMLRQHAPDTAPSRTQVYRYFHGEAAPTIVTVNDFARLFGVSPRFFLPETPAGPPLDRPARP